MNWLVVVALSVMSYASEIFIDNYISDVYFKEKGAVAQKWFFGFAQTIFGILLFVVTLVAVGIDFAAAGWQVFALLIVSGFFTSIASIFYYKALEIDDSTNLGIFIQLSPVFYLIFGWLILGQTFNPLQFLAFAVIIAAPLLIIFTTRKKSRGVRVRAVLFALLYVVISTLANILFVQEDANAAELSFFVEFAFLYMGKGIGNLVVMGCAPKLRRRFHYVSRASHKKVYRPLSASFFCSVFTNLTYNAALILAPSVAVASAASDSAIPIVVFFAGIILTAIWPKFGREKMDRKTVIVHLVATMLVVIGIVMIQNLS